MNKARARTKRSYSSNARREAANETRARILANARELFGKRGVDAVTIAEIAHRSEVAASTIYAIYKSKEGILRKLMEQSLFGARFQAAQEVLAGVSDPVEAIALTSHVARAVYESESRDLGLLRGVSGFSPALRKVEEEFERMRLEMQEGRVRGLYQAGKGKRGIRLDEAQRIMWMLTSREVYRMLVIDSGWTPGRYQEWLAETLVAALVERGEGGSRSRPAVRS